MGNSTLTANNLQTAPQTQGNFIFHNGASPSLDLCKNHLTGCWQGYITDQENNFILQVMRLVTQMAHANDNTDTGAYLQLKNCLSDHLPKIALDLANKLSNPLNQESNTCATSQSQWHGWSATAQMTGHFSDKTCTSFQNAFLSQANDCESYLGATKNYFLYIILPIAAFVAIAVAASACWQHIKSNKNSDQHQHLINGNGELDNPNNDTEKEGICKTLLSCCLWVAKGCPEKESNTHRNTSPNTPYSSI